MNEKRKIAGAQLREQIMKPIQKKRDTAGQKCPTTALPAKKKKRISFIMFDPPASAPAKARSWNSLTHKP
jgi:hypothetical protein